MLLVASPCGSRHPWYQNYASCRASQYSLLPVGLQIDRGWCATASATHTKTTQLWMVKPAMIADKTYHPTWCYRRRSWAHHSSKTPTNGAVRVTYHQSSLVHLLTKTRPVISSSLCLVRSEAKALLKSTMAAVSMMSIASISLR